MRAITGAALVAAFLAPIPSAHAFPIPTGTCHVIGSTTYTQTDEVPGGARFRSVTRTAKQCGASRRFSFERGPWSPVFTH